MHHGPLDTLEGLKGFTDQLGPGLHQHLYGDVVGNTLLFNQLAQKVIVMTGCRGEAHFNGLEANGYQLLPESQLLLGVHWLDQRLVPIPQIHRAPLRRRIDDAIRPTPVRLGYRREGSILAGIKALGFCGVHDIHL